MRKWLAVFRAVIRSRPLVAGVALLVLSPVVFGQLEYAVTEIPALPGDSTSNPNGLNDNGQVVGNSSGSFQEAFVYENGTISALAGNGSVAFQINDNGEIAGEVGGAAATGTATSGLQSLGFLGSANAINNAGQIAAAYDPEGNKGNNHAALYAKGQLTLTGELPGGGGSNAYAINNGGEIAGWSYSSSGTQPIVYSNGTLTPLPTLPGAINTEAEGINDAGQVVGETQLSGNFAGFLYSNGTVSNVGTLGGDTFAYGINNNGEIVGASNNQAFVGSGGTLTNLNTVLDPITGAGWNLNVASAINNNGQIVGTGTLNGQPQGFLLTPKVVTVSTNRTPSLNLTNVNQPNPQTDFDVFNGTTFVPGGTLKANLPTIVLTHGFAENVSQWPTALANELAGAGTSFNVVAWNWQNDARGTIGKATSRTYNEGMNLGEALLGELGPSYSQNIQFIGHSLGTLVNAEAINIFGGAEAQATIQDTLLDEAELANHFTSSAPLAPLPMVRIQSIDNYISAFGNLLDGNSVDGTANVILLNQPTNPFPPVSDLLSVGKWALDAHGYPITWYEETVTNPSLASNAGYNWSIANPSGTEMPTGRTYYMQSSSSEYDLSSISATCAQNIINERNATLAVVSPVEFEAALNYLGLTAPIQTNNQVSATLMNQTTPEILLTKQAQTTGSETPSAGKSITAVESADASSASSSSYAWLPIAIPSNAQYMSLDFTYQGLSPGDFLSVGLDDTMLFALESEFVTDGMTNNTGLLDISQWAGEDEELFLGLNAVDNNNEGGTILVNNIEFESVPEPTTFAMICISSLFLMRRYRHHPDQGESNVSPLALKKPEPES